MKRCQQLRHRNRDTGASIIEVLIVAGIMSIIMSAVAATFATQQREARSLQQKLELAELKNLMLQVFSANSSVCTWQLRNRVIDGSSATTTTPSSTVLNLGALYQGPDDSSPLLAKPNLPLPLSMNGLVVDEIHFTEIISTGLPDQYRGTFKISFKHASLQRSIKPVTLAQMFSTNPSDPITAKKITECNGSSSSARFWVPLNTLTQYHNVVGNDCLNMNTNKMNFDSACSRFCGTGCIIGQANCSGTLPSMGYVSGIANECNGTANTAQCACFR